LGCVRGTIAPSASTSPATPLVDDSRGVPRAAIGIEGRAQIPLRRCWLDKAEGGRRLLRRLFGLCFITNGPTTPAHFVRVVEIFARELVLPRLNDALRVADHILHFARDFDVLKSLHCAVRGGAVPRLTPTKRSVFRKRGRRKKPRRRQRGSSFKRSVG
jgi:hypothetical protein